MQPETDKNPDWQLSAEDMRQQAESATAILIEEHAKQVTEKERDLLPDGPELLAESLTQFFNILETLEHKRSKQNNVLTEDMQQLADHGMGLFTEMVQWAERLNCEEAMDTFHFLTIPLALWAVTHQLKLSDIQLLVNTFSNMANHTEETNALCELSDVMESIFESITETLKQDSDKTSSGRPWRILNFNHAIVATRTHDPKRMEAIFERLMYRLPEDVSGFFKEGMEQMDVIGYPEYIRSVMKKYFLLTNKPTLH